MKRHTPEDNQIGFGTAQQFIVASGSAQSKIDCGTML